ELRSLFVKEAHYDGLKKRTLNDQHNPGEISRFVVQIFNIERGYVFYFRHRDDRITEAMECTNY
ncbi:MAG: hypothetical protein ACTHW8_11520, partial [Sphingobacterium sp.]